MEDSTQGSRGESVLARMDPLRQELVVQSPTLSGFWYYIPASSNTEESIGYQPEGSRDGSYLKLATVTDDCGASGYTRLQVLQARLVMATPALCELGNQLGDQYVNFLREGGQTIRGDEIQSIEDLRAIQEFIRGNTLLDVKEKFGNRYRDERLSDHKEAERFRVPTPVPNFPLSLSSGFTVYDSQPYKLMEIHSREMRNLNAGREAMAIARCARVAHIALTATLRIIHSRTLDERLYGPRFDPLEEGSGLSSAPERQARDFLYRISPGLEPFYCDSSTIAPLLNQRAELAGFAQEMVKRLPETPENRAFLERARELIETVIPKDLRTRDEIEESREMDRLQVARAAEALENSIRPIEERGVAPEMH